MVSTDFKGKCHVEQLDDLPFVDVAESSLDRVMQYVDIRLVHDILSRQYIQQSTQKIALII